MKKMFAHAAHVIFGVDPDNISATLKDACFSLMVERMPLLTIVDAQTAYRSTKKTGKSSYTVTRDELLQPIEDYWMNKGRVILAIETEKKRQDEALAFKTNFRKHAEAMYRESLEKGEWIGTPFEANYLANDYKAAGYFSEQEIEKLTHKANDIYSEDRKRMAVAQEFVAEAMADMPVPPAEYVLSHLMIQSVVKRGVNLIVE